MAELSTLARPYARAAFHYARDTQKLDVWEQQLDTVAAVYAHPKVRSILESPAVSASEQAKLFKEVCGEALSEQVTNFVELLATNKRLPLLPEIDELYRELKNAHEQAIDVEVITALPLDDSTEDKLAKTLSAKLSRKANIHTVVDESLMAGVIIKAGDVVIDGSVRGRLEKLAKAIKG